MKSRAFPYLVTLLASLGVLASVWVIDRSEQARFRQQNRMFVLHQLSAMRGKLEAAFNKRIFLVRGLLAYVALHPDIDAAEFQGLAEKLMGRQTGIRSLQLARNSVISHIYPLAGNEAALGDDLLGDPARRDAAERAIRMRDIVIAGPVALRQGGVSVIGRAPIFLLSPGAGPGDGDYWGLAVILIDLDILLLEAGLLDHTAELRYALRSLDGVSAEGSAFFGDGAMFQTDPIILEVSLPNGSWQLASMPVGGWPSLAPGSWTWRTGGGLLALFGGVLAWVLARDPPRLRKAIQQATAALRDSEERLARIVETNAEGILIVDRDGRITLANAAVEHILGLPRHLIIGSTYNTTTWKRTTLDGKPLPDEQLVFSRVIQKGGPVRDVEYTIERPDGSQVILSANGAPLRDTTAAALIGVVISVSDITERKLAEAALADEKERLAVTLRSIGDGVITTDTEGKIVLLNKVAEALTGWAQEEACGRPLTEVFKAIHARTREPLADPVQLVLTTGGIVERPQQPILVARDGIERLIADTSAPIRDQHGKMFGVVLVFRDITDKRRVEEELLRATKLESVGLLAGGIAHDFNNILMAVMGNIALARLSLSAEDQLLKRLSAAEHACLRAKDLTQQLMTFAKGGEPIKQPASIAELLQEAASFALRGSNVRYECAIAKDLWPVEIDAGQISQVIHNLIINADQAMPGGGVIWIQAENLRVSTEGVEPGVPLHEGRYVKIAIIDQGIGIPKEHLPKIFDPYFTTKQGGSGLGLATTYAVIKKHGGYITTGSELGVGSTFRIYLPAAQRPIISRRDGAAPPQGGRGRILVMDDEETIRELVGDILSQIGYEAAFARDGDEAIERYKKARETGRPFAAVIMDLTIPGGMGGKEAIQQLRAIDPEVKGIVSSGYSNDPVMADFRAYGFMGVIAKPYRPSELSDVVHRVLLG